MKTFFRRTSAVRWQTLLIFWIQTCLVIGGGLSKFKELYREGVAEVARQVFSDSLETPIVENQLGDSAGVIGAALVGL